MITCIPILYDLNYLRPFFELSVLFYLWFCRLTFILLIFISIDLFSPCIAGGIFTVTQNEPPQTKSISAAVCIQFFLPKSVLQHLLLSKYTHHFPCKTDSVILRHLLRSMPLCYRKLCLIKMNGIFSVHLTEKSHQQCIGK